MAVTGDAASHMTRKMTLDVPDVTQEMSEQARWTLDVGMARLGLSLPDFTDYLAPSILAGARSA